MTYSVTFPRQSDNVVILAIAVEPENRREQIPRCHDAKSLFIMQLNVLVTLVAVRILVERVKPSPPEMGSYTQGEREYGHGRGSCGFKCADCEKMEENSDCNKPVVEKEI